MFQVLIRHAEVQKTRYSHGLYVKFSVLGESKYAETPVKSNTLSPEFNFSKIFSFPAITADHLEWFEHGCLSFLVYAKQNDKIQDQRLAKMTTKVNFSLY